MHSPNSHRTMRDAVLATLDAFAAETLGHRPWMAAADLARRTGTSVHDTQFEATIQTLFEAGTIRLMSGGDANGGSFYKAMLVPSLEPKQAD